MSKPASRKPSVRAVVFDIGGVMTRLNPPTEFFDTAAIELVIPAIENLDAGEIDPESFIRHVAEISGKPAALIARAFDEWIGEPYDGLEPLIDDLHAAGVTTACLSNTNARHWQRLAGDADALPPIDPHLPLDRLHYRFTSFELGRRKPLHDIYHHAAALLALPASSILFFDDTEHNVHAARDAGWLAERIDPDAETAPQMRDHLSRHGVLSI
ncbi:MAG: HAD-IA family hydrolase [Planctomycetota bacterium]